MTTYAEDRWTQLDDPEAVAAAAQRLDQFARIPSEQAAWERIIELLAPQQGDDILDVGAGSGDISVRLARRVAPHGTLTAIDLSPGLLEHARERAREAGLDFCLGVKAADARALPCADNSFDRALCHWVLLHLDDPAAVLSELQRVVCPGGWIVCVEVDWATMTVEPGNPGITQEVVAANVARQVDGRMGNKLAPLVREHGFDEVTVVPIEDVETTPDSAGSWLDFLTTRIAVAEEAGVSSQALAQWWQEISDAARQGRYAFSLTQFAVAARVP